jgi:sarcosine oxidase
MTYDWAVVGAGVFGSWIAQFLRRAGKSVLLLDAYGPGNSRASSGGESRLIRASYGADEIYTRWAQQSLPHWMALSQSSTLPLFHRVGVMRWAGREDAHLASSIACLDRCGVPFEVLEGDELERRYPQIRFDPGTRALLEPEAGALMARRSVETLVRELVGQGVEYRRETVLGSDTGIPARSFVFACGPWLPKVFPDVLGKRIRPTRQEVFFFGSPAGVSHVMPGWIDSGDRRNPYGFPDLEHRGIKMAFHDIGPPFDPDTDNRDVSAQGVAAARAYLANRFPALGDAPLVEARVCQYENTSSGDFLIDRHPGRENVWLVGGGSGHGFKHGPALGEYFVKTALHGVDPEPRFSLASKSEDPASGVL